MYFLGNPRAFRGRVIACGRPHLAAFFCLSLGGAMPHIPMSAWQSSLLVVSVALAGGWLLMLWLVSMSGRPRHVRARPEAGDLGPEPPAVAGMLCHGGRVGDEAAAATLLDLAARHVIDLEAVDDQLSLCRLRPPGGADLAPYERRIRSYLDALATDGVVP